MEDYRAILLDILNKEYSPSRPGIHLSDLINCPRQSYFRKIHGNKHDERTLSAFFDGQGIHIILQKLLAKHYPGRFKIENRQKVNGTLTFTPDIIDTWTQTVIEVKTARSPTVVYAPKQTHVDQLKAYMAFMGLYNGVIFYHIITKEQTDLFASHPVTITPQEAKEIGEHWIIEAEQLRLAVKLKDMKLARHIADDPNKNWLCNGYCPYKDICPEGKAAVQKIIEERTIAKREREEARRAKKASAVIDTATLPVTIVE